MSDYDRLFATIVTPFKPGTYDVDEEALRGFVSYFMQPKFLDAGGAIIINPACGEAHYLSREEMKRNVEITVKEVAGRTLVFAGTAAPTTRESVAISRDAKEAGADGLFLFSPMGDAAVTGAWNAEKYPEVWINMARAIEDAVDLPAIAHPLAQSTPSMGVQLPVSAVLRICTEVPQIVGWKMIGTYQAHRALGRGLRTLNRHVAFLTASGNYLLEDLATGYFDGTSSGSWNYSMEPCVDLILAMRRDDLAEARRIWSSGLSVLHEYVYSEGSRMHCRYKIASWLRGLIPAPFQRPPLPTPSIAEALKLRQLMLETGLSVPVDESEIERVIPRVPPL